jgi:hypothetical protein
MREIVCVSELNCLCITDKMMLYDFHNTVACLRTLDGLHRTLNMKNLAKRFTGTRSGIRLLLAGSAFVLLAACQSAPVPPTMQMQAAENAIGSAEQERVADFAPQDIRQALEKFSAARLAIQSEDMTAARRLADEARVSAELAMARTAEIKAKTVNDNMLESINTLRLEMQRNSGTTQ